MNTNTFEDLLDNFFDTPRVSSFQLMTQGKENTTALVQTNTDKIIVRIWGETHGYMGAHAKNDIADEAAFMDFCHANNMPVPKLFRSKSGNLYEKTSEGRYYSVMEYVEGVSPERFTNDMSAQIATTMAKMHLLVANFQFPEARSWPGTVIDMTNDRIAAFETGAYVHILGTENHLIQSAINDYRTLLKSCDLTKLPSGVIHGDIMWENMKFKDGRLVGVFDFGDCRESYFIEDITKTLLFAFESPRHCLFGENGANIQSFLNAYHQERELTVAEQQSLRVFFLSRFLYQTLGYCAKVAKGDHEYTAKVHDVITRYSQHMAFFAKAAYM